LAQKIINTLSGKELFENEQEHYCVHSPESLIEEVLSFAPKFSIETIDTDRLYISNLPKKLSFMYFGADGFLFLIMFLKLYKSLF